MALDMVLNTLLSHKRSPYYYNADVCKDPNDYRSSRPEVFCKKGVLKGFAKFTGKHLCQSPLFNKVAGLQACNFILKNEHRTPLVAAAFVISSKWTA